MSFFGEVMEKNGKRMEEEERFGENGRENR